VFYGRLAGCGETKGDQRVAPELVDRDAEHLKILAIFQYAAAGVAALVGCFPILHVLIGASILLTPDSIRGSGRNAMPREIGFVFVGLGGAFVLAGWTIAGAHFLIARFLKQTRHYWFCIIASCATCLFCMFSSGIIGVASLVILLRPGVRELFEAKLVGSGAAAAP
jgi:hypothetical protein